MKKIVKRSLFILIGIFILAGCRDEKDTAQPQSFLRIEESTENESHAPLYYILDPITENISVLDSMDNEFEYYNLEKFEITEQKTEFSYDSKGVTLNLVSDYLYEDSFGNTYRMKTISEEN